LRYEEVQTEEAFSAVLRDCTTDDLAKVIITYDAQRAESLLYQLRDVVAQRECERSKLAFPLRHYIELSNAPVEKDEQNNWIGKEWDGWSGEQRMAQVKEEIFKCGGMGWHGTNLRKLRSTLVEEWLASPEPPRRSPRGIPRQVSKKAGGEWG
jgi:hypothetical protein